ncbi:MAG: SMC-Scp complex subunit ScpB [Lachnospiraceae bacterium]|nr:SMC-Scp complex subunit ScpB [Lachnospiraceae bacterium]
MQSVGEEITPVNNPKAVIGAVLFSVGNSVEYKKLSRVLGRDVDETKKLVYELKEEYDGNEDCGFTIIELEESVQMCSKASMYEYLIKIAKVPKSYSLTDSMLETLSIIAYKQPVTRLEIEKIRGVNCDHAINKLVEYGLVTELGRLQAPGRPLLFGTTEEFLRSFNVTSLDDLPTASPDRIEEFKKEAAEEVSLKLDI